MYHSIARDVDDGLNPYYRTVTTPNVFRAHMDFLRHEDYHVVTLSEAVPFLRGIADAGGLGPPPMPNSGTSQVPPRRRVVLTFDDGFRDFYTTAFPILERVGFRATVFLTSGCIDKPFVTGRECLRTQEIDELAREGIEFGSHTVSHRHLQALSTAEIVYELATSKERIESITGAAVSLFSYPYRFPEEDVGFTRKFGALLTEQGYSAGVTTAIGRSRRGDDLRFLRRLPLNDCDDTRLLRAKLEGAYDWLHKGQLFYKRSRAMFAGPRRDDTATAVPSS
jgi:peptidoglycan/xylan/chitin deacetylase (PgdA/CDA1 family)